MKTEIILKSRKNLTLVFFWGFKIRLELSGLLDIHIFIIEVFSLLLSKQLINQNLVQKDTSLAPYRLQPGDDQICLVGAFSHSLRSG
jgi:hypothetical protein